MSLLSMNLVLNYFSLKSWSFSKRKQTSYELRSIPENNLPETKMSEFGKS